MRQKILLSAALLHNPDVLIFDEPLSGLDVNTMIAVRELLKELAAQGRIIFYCSHVLDVMEKVCARVLILRKGRVVADDTIENLREQMDQTSLEGVFTRVTEEAGKRNLAGRILEVMRLMKRLEETHGANFELVRHFLARIFDSEMISTRGSWGTVAVSAFALAVPAGMLFLSMAPHRLQSAEAVRAAAMAGALANLTLFLAITGILALLAWQSLFPSRRDYLALAGLPVRSRQIFLARFALRRAARGRGLLHRRSSAEPGRSGPAGAHRRHLPGLYARSSSRLWPCKVC